MTFTRSRKFGLISLIIISAIYIIFSQGERQNLVEIDYLDVGQGDSSLIKIANKTVLIDGGPDNLVLKRLGENLPYYQRNIDYILISHLHDDHITGLFEVIRRFKIGALIYMRGAESSLLMETLIEMARARDIKVIALPKEANIKLAGNCSLYLFNPLSLDIKKDSNNSLITKLNCPRIRALFTGDSSATVEKALLKKNIDWSAEYFKAAHHGSKTANSEEFLRAINPTLMIISVGALNHFGHPSSEILQKIKSLGIKIKRTDREKTIKILANP